MRYRYVFLALLLMMLSAESYAQKSKTTRFSWLSGRWKNPETHQYEVWEVDWESDYLKGKGFEIAQGDTTVHELLAIEYQKGSYYYMADVPHNSAPVLFKITAIGKHTFSCENPQHDFPKKITYELISRKRLQATISGNGKSMTFLFDKL